MKELARHIEEVFAIGGSVAWAVGVCGVVSLALGITQILHAALRRWGNQIPGARLSQILTSGSSIAWALFTVGCGFLISSSRSGIVTGSWRNSGILGLSGPSRLGERVELSRLLTLHFGVLIFGACAVGALILVAALAIRMLPQVRQGASHPAILSRPPSIPWLLLLWMPLCTALATAGFGSRALSPPGCFGDGADRMHALERILLEAAQPLEVARWALLSLASLAIVSVVIGAMVGRRSAHSRRLEATSISIFILGVAAFAGSRAAAYDARHPLRPYSRPFEVHEIETPTIGGCQLVWGPVLDLGPNTTSFRGSRMDNLTTLTRQLEDERFYWSALRAHALFDGRLIVVADPAQPFSDLLPWLRVAQQAGYRDIRIGVFRSRSIPTASLGPLLRTEACAEEVELSQLLNPAEPEISWGAHTEALMAPVR